MSEFAVSLMNTNGGKAEWSRDRTWSRGTNKHRDWPNGPKWRRDRRTVTASIWRGRSVMRAKRVSEHCGIVRHTSTSKPVWCLSSLAVTRNCLPRTFRVIPVDGPIQHTAIFVGIQISGCAFIAFQQFRRAFHFGRLILQVKNSLHKCRRQWWNLLPSIAVRRLLAMCESRAINLIIDRIRCPYSFCYLIMKKCQFS